MAPLKASGTSKERIGGGLSTNKLHMNIAFMTWRRVFLNIKCESNTGSVRLFPVSACLFAAAPPTIAGFLWWFSSLLGTFFFFIPAAGLLCWLLFVWGCSLLAVVNTERRSLPRLWKYVISPSFVVCWLFCHLLCWLRDWSVQKEKASISCFVMLCNVTNVL